MFFIPIIPLPKKKNDETDFELIDTVEMSSILFLLIVFIMLVLVVYKLIKSEFL